MNTTQPRLPKFRRDLSVSAAYLTVSTKPIRRTVEMTVNVDIDSRGHVVGVEFLTWPPPPVAKENGR